jgi:glutathione peroxidase
LKVADARGTIAPLTREGDVREISAFARRLVAVGRNEATGQPPKWNFHKYLITPGARQVYSFNTRVEPDAPEIMGQLTPLLR